MRDPKWLLATLDKLLLTCMSMELGSVCTPAQFEFSSYGRFPAGDWDSEDSGTEESGPEDEEEEAKEKAAEKGGEAKTDKLEQPEAVKGAGAGADAGSLST